MCSSDLILPAAGALLARYIALRIESRAPFDRWARAQVGLAAVVLCLVGLALPAVLAPWLAVHEGLRPLHVAAIAIATAALLACGVVLWRAPRARGPARARSAGGRPPGAVQPPPAPRHHSRAPSGPPLPRRPAPSNLRRSRTFWRASAKWASNRPGSHIWNFSPRPPKVMCVVMPACYLSRTGRMGSPS